MFIRACTYLVLLKYNCKYSAFCVLFCQFQLKHSSKFMKSPRSAFELAQDFKYWSCQLGEKLV